MNPYGTTPAAPAAGIPVQRPGPAAARHTILVADDDADARLVMRAALRKAGFDVVLADGGRDALQRFAAQPCDMVMLDVDMPDLDGHQVCAALRGIAGPLLPIVMVTGMDDVASVETAYQCGATDFIAKPVNWALIGHRVRYLFRGHQAMLDLRAAEARNTAILDAIPDLLFEVDGDGRFVDYRAPRRELLAARPEQFLGRTIEEVLPPEASAVCMAALREAHAEGNSSGRQYALELPHGRAWFELSIARKGAVAGEAARYIALSRDVTERKEAEARIARLAYFDGLTGLPNRGAFLDRVNRAIRRAEQRQARLSVLFMDLDGFKNINDSMGHAAGDQLLQGAAQRLRDGLRPSDMVSRPMGSADDDSADVQLARLGGDEFTAMLVDIAGPEDALAVARRIGELMRQPFVVEGREVTLSTSIGIAVHPEDGHDAATLLKHADTAMYLAKRSGRDNAQLYSAALTDEVTRRMELDAMLRTALDRDEFHLLYQPQIDIATGLVVGVEALIRWRHPTRGLVSPLEFIPLAEANGVIEAIGRWVLATACQQAAAWRRQGHPVRVAVNLSPLQFSSSGIADTVVDVLTASGLPAELLELEVTEGALMENTAATRQTLQALHDHGVHIALDDFGTGYSSLAYLTRMPIDHLKIDRAFVACLLDGGESAAIIRAVLAMAHGLGLNVTAEGVETAEQARALSAMGCDRLQGFHFSRPLPADEVAALLPRRWNMPDAPPHRPALTRVA